MIDDIDVDVDGYVIMDVNKCILKHMDGLVDR